jgi:hypothetical protein
MYMQRTEENLEVIWAALQAYRADLIPEGDEHYDEIWSDVCTAMAWIAEDLGGVCVKKTEGAFEMLENSEVMQEFEDCLWLKVDRRDYEAFFKCPTDESRSYGPSGAPCR